MTTDQGNWVKSDAETELRRMLRGVGLVGELDLCTTSRAYQLARGNMERFVRDMASARLVVRNYPASVVVYLVSQGVYGYDHGGFWNHLDIPGIDANEYGPASVVALRDLGLETFADVKPEGAYRWVTPILLHGGIPKFCAGDVLRLIAGELRQGSADATEMVSQWLQAPKRMSTLDRPVERFLTHGGAQAVDLIERLIAMVRTGASDDRLDPDQLGLPAYLVEAYQALPANERNVRQQGGGLPNAVVRFDYTAGSGPELVLPVVPSGRGATSWVVVGERHQRVGISRNAVQTVPLPVGASWEVLLAGNEGVLRSTVLRGVANTPVLLFDPESMQLLRNQDRVTTRSVIALAPPGFAFRQDSASGEAIHELESELPPLSGDWRWYEARHLDLDGVGAMWVGDGRPSVGLKTAAAIVRVASSESRPHIVGEISQGVMTVSGRQVYSAAPVLVVPGASSVGWDRWRLTASCNGQVRTWAPSELSPVGDRIDLSVLMDGSSAVSIDLDLLGPLGGDLRNVRIAVVDGLEVDRVDRVIRPDETIEVELRTGRNVDDPHDGTTRMVRFGPGEASAVVDVGDHGTPLNLVVSIPRLMWAWRHGNNDVTPLGTQRVVLGIDEVGLDDTLLLRTGRRTKTTLELVAGDKLLQELPWVETVGTEGRWAFPVGTFRDSIKRSERGRLQVQARIDGHAVPVARIVAEYLVTNLVLMSEVTGVGDADLVVQFDENRHFPGRELRLWSRDRPWDAARCEPIADEADGAAGVRIKCAIPPGTYLAEIRLADNWATPLRPRPNDPGVFAVTIGDATDLRRYRLALDRDNPAGQFEAALAERVRPSDLTRQQRLAMAPLAALTVGQLVEAEGARASEMPEYDVALAVLCDPVALLRGAEQAIEFGLVADNALLQVLITLLPDLLTMHHHDPDVDPHRAHRSHPVLGLLLDPAADAVAAARWAEHLGVDPLSDDPRTSMPARGAEVGDYWLSFSVDRLREIGLSLDLSDQQPLATGGFIKAMLQWLSLERQADHTGTTDWVNEHRKLNDIRVRKLSPLHDQYLESVKPIGLDRPTITRFPFDLLAAAIQLVSIRSSRRAATRALLEASELAPMLTVRSVLVALFLHLR
jgi:hypothetical protein